MNAAGWLTKWFGSAASGGTLSSLAAWHQFPGTGATGVWIDPDRPYGITYPGPGWSLADTIWAPLPRCECGAHLCRDAGHALWCPVYDR